MSDIASILLAANEEMRLCADFSKKALRRRPICRFGASKTRLADFRGVEMCLRSKLSEAKPLENQGFRVPVLVETEFVQHRTRSDVCSILDT